MSFGTRSKLDGTEAQDEAVGLAVDLIERETGRFEPKRMPNEYARAVHELVQAKVEHRAPEVSIEEASRTPKVVNIMDALKKSMQAKGRSKVRDAVRRRMGKGAPIEKPTLLERGDRAARSPKRTAH